MAETGVTLNEFLADAHTRLQDKRLQEVGTVRLVVGNEASDPDSCASAIAVARELAHAWPAAAWPDTVAAPVLAIPRADFKLQLDRVHLLRRAGLAGTGDGVDWSPAHVTFIDELDWAALAKSGRLELFLVDHNKLPAALAAYGAHVREIVDHHEDEGEYEWVEPGVGSAAGPAARRNVEFGIGSCASLVAERLEAKAPALAREPAVAALLLGAVVLDTANLQPKAKAQKAREAAVAQRLLAAAAPLLGVSADASGRTAFFDELLEVKADAATLLQFATADLLRQDFKSETLPGSGVAVGVASVVVGVDPLLARADLLADMRAFAAARGLGLLLLMSCDFRNRRRQLVVHAEPPLLDAVVAHLRDALELTPMTGGSSGDDPALKAYEQGAYAISRKALMPILRKLEVSAL